MLQNFFDKLKLILHATKKLKKPSRNKVAFGYIVNNFFFFIPWIN